MPAHDAIFPRRSQFTHASGMARRYPRPSAQITSATGAALDPTIQTEKKRGRSYAAFAPRETHRRFPFEECAAHFAIGPASMRAPMADPIAKYLKGHGVLPDIR